MEIALWNKKDSGVLLDSPLLLDACREKRFGTHIEFRGGAVDRALFTYLSGTPNELFFRSNPEWFYEQFLVCMSREWEVFLRAQPSLSLVMARQMMQPMCGVSKKALPPLPAGYKLGMFDLHTFEKHPFGHGANYKNFQAFAKDGSGAVVRYQNEIVASASSFLSFGQEVELDVFTDERHRRKGLADHCVAAMMEDCASRGLTIHWDAQNAASACMAKSHGFALKQEYAVYMLRFAEGNP
ncbi:MAG: GNAT family N-acetyltransferase [Candidatus Heritagella sp.]